MRKRTDRPVSARRREAEHVGKVAETDFDEVVAVHAWFDADAGVSLAPEELGEPDQVGAVERVGPVDLECRSEDAASLLLEPGGNAWIRLPEDALTIVPLDGPGVDSRLP